MTSRDHLRDKLWRARLARSRVFIRISSGFAKPRITLEYLLAAEHLFSETDPADNTAITLRCLRIRQTCLDIHIAAKIWRDINASWYKLRCLLKLYNYNK